jgi:hypothetical protein
MSRTWVGVLAFAGGVAAGLIFADWYAKSKATGGVNSFLSAIGVTNPGVQNAVDSVAVPVIVG